MKCYLGQVHCLFSICIYLTNFILRKCFYFRFWWPVSIYLLCSPVKFFSLIYPKSMNKILLPSVTSHWIFPSESLHTFSVGLNNIDDQFIKLSHPIRSVHYSRGKHHCSSILNFNAMFQLPNLSLTCNFIFIAAMVRNNRPVDSH